MPLLGAAAHIEMHAHSVMLSSLPAEQSSASAWQLGSPWMRKHTPTMDHVSGNGVLHGGAQRVLPGSGVAHQGCVVDLLRPRNRLNFAGTRTVRGVDHEEV